MSDIDRAGYGVLEGFLSEKQLQSARDFVNSEVVKNGNQYFSYTGHSRIEGTILSELGESAELANTFTRLLSMKNDKALSATTPYVVLRCLKGQSGRKQSYKFHFDAYVITMLVPLVIPTTSQRSGDLLIFPNIRGIRSNPIINVAEKAVIQNRLAASLLRKMIEHGFLKPQVLKLVPGNAYFFWGYQSLHANEPCEVDALRATAIFHFGQPHQNSRMVKLIEHLNQRRGEVKVT
jgi:hypothetical protein